MNSLLIILMNTYKIFNFGILQGHKNGKYKLSEL